VVGRNHWAQLTGHRPCHWIPSLEIVDQTGRRYRIVQAQAVDHIIIIIIITAADPLPGEFR